MKQFLIIRHMEVVFELWERSALNALECMGAYDPASDSLNESMLTIERIGHYRECLLIAPPAGQLFSLWSKQCIKKASAMNLKLEAITWEQLQHEKTIYA